MATWQFDLHLMYRGEPMPTASDDGLDIPGIPVKLALYVQEMIAGSLGKPWLMMDDWIVFGIETGTRVDLLFDEADSVEVLVRLDVSVDNDAFLDTICTLALQLNCSYFDVQGRQFIEPRRELLLQAMASSKAAKFVKSPRDFIAQIPTG
ncbi:hypothetical protein [Janthinobacterium fluminis]|uniref:Uncharacterized protein n=1 Tax=Janthinobacterium fluminis TaxID=2987524 RepID=A0ABT5JV82_9BURK|nr:hypothetical protein [Janthinobacterium fluminis]MDC8756085.1 hypothetical protein [Janthinobacterium fluminis]